MILRVDLLELLSFILLWTTNCLDNGGDFTEEPTTQDFSYRQDIRIWKKSHLQMIHNAHERKHVDMLLWTPSWHWSSDIEGTWLNMYKAHHKDELK